MYSVPKLKSFSEAALDKAVEKLRAALKQEAAAVKNGADQKAFRDRWMARKDGVLMPSTSPCPAFAARSARNIPSSKRCTRLSPSSAISATQFRKGR